MNGEWDDIEKALNFITEKLKIPYSNARRLLHRYICRGLCDWYQRKAHESGFASMIITEDQKRIMEEALTKFVIGRNLEEKIKRTHKYLCPGEPCSK